MSPKNAEKPPRIRRYLLRRSILFLGTILIVASTPFLVMASPQAGMTISDTDALWLTNGFLGVLTGINLLLVLCASSKDIETRGKLTKIFYPLIRHGKKFAGLGLIGSLLYGCSWIFSQFELLTELNQSLNSWLPQTTIYMLAFAMILMIRGLAIQALPDLPALQAPSSDSKDDDQGPNNEDFSSNDSFEPDQGDSRAGRNGSSGNRGAGAADDDDDTPTDPRIPKVPVEAGEEPPTKRFGRFSKRK